MNEQLQKELAAWLSKLREAADAGGSFVLEQAPLIVQEKIAYGRVSAVVWMVIGAVGIAVAIKYAPRLFARASAAGAAWEQAWKTDEWKKGTPERHLNAQAGHFIGGLACIAIGVLGCVLFIGSLETALKVWFAPRLYVLEWLAGLLK